MPFQYNDVITGCRTLLIPYRKEHVPEYHKWLQRPEIIELTETEPCSLGQEYQYQMEWEADGQSTKLIKLIQVQTTSRLIGDVNLFFSHDLADAEINIMIAESECRGQGYAKEAVELIIKYRTAFLPIYSMIPTTSFTIVKASGRPFKRIIAKILSHNQQSVQFFQSLGFTLESEANIFNELVLVRNM